MKTYNVTITTKLTKLFAVSYLLLNIVEAVVVTHKQGQSPQRRQNRREFLITIVDVSNNTGAQQRQLVL